MEGHQDVSYELLVRGMRQDFEDKVFALQKRAEENMKGTLISESSRVNWLILCPCMHNHI